MNSHKTARYYLTYLNLICTETKSNTCPHGIRFLACYQIMWSPIAMQRNCQLWISTTSFWGENAFVGNSINTKCCRNEPYPQLRQKNKMATLVGGL